MNLTERRLMRRGNWRFVAEKTAVAAGMRLRRVYATATYFHSSAYGSGGCGGDTRFAKRTDFGGFNAFTAQSGSVSVAITETARPAKVDA